MKRLQFLLTLPAAALGVTTKPTLSRAARDKAEEFGVPLVLGGQKLQKVFVHRNLEETLAFFHFEDFKVEVCRTRYKDPGPLFENYVNVSVYSLVSPQNAYMTTCREVSEKEVVRAAVDCFLKQKNHYNEI